MVTYTRKGIPSRVQHELVSPEQYNLPSWVHPEVLYHFDEWQIIRDVVAGEKEIKKAATSYLPRFETMDDAEYNAYLDRATYYGFTGRTVSALAGTLFKRAPKITAPVKLIEERLESITLDNQSIHTFFRQIGKEILTLGRFGVLVDLPAVQTVQPNPYMVGYTAENIVDWDTADVDGRSVLTRVVLREYHIQGTRGGFGSPSFDTVTKKSYAAYRVLRLDDGVYTQEYYQADRADADINTRAHIKAIQRPMRQGKNLNFIPFRFFGMHGSSPRVTKGPMVDIARLNLSHYRSYAHLEQGRFFTGFPVYYVEMASAGNESAGYEIGPSRVWEIAAGGKAGILEFNGHGLRSLETALNMKETQAASLGGRMIGLMARATAESDNQTKLKERNEQSLLLDISSTMDEGCTQLLRWLAWWAGESENSVAGFEVEFNKYFLMDNTGAREFRAIAGMYSDGILPVEVIYDYFSRAEIIPEWMSVDEFRELLESPDSFPAQPDAEARFAGYPSKQSQLSEKLAEDELAIEAAKVEDQQKARDDAAKQADKARKSAEKVAKEAPPPVAEGLPAPPNRGTTRKKPPRA